jgi:predicted transcriptional regulator of viral defense system
LVDVASRHPPCKFKSGLVAREIHRPPRHGCVLRIRVEAPVRSFDTARGTLLVSTVEATAIDLVGYERHAGGLDQVATVLSELAGQVDPQRLVAAAQTAPLPWIQRLGYLLELAGAANRAASLKTYVQDKAREATFLVPAGPRGKGRHSLDWNLYIDADVEVAA